MRYRFHPEARTELIESVWYYDSQRPGLGRRFLEAATDAIRRIQDHPHMHRVVSDPWRQCRITPFPFGIIYKVGARQIEIIAVMHLHRRPGYWRNRVTNQ